MKTNVILTIGIIVDLFILALSIAAILQRKREAFFMWGKWTWLASLGLAAGILLSGTVMSDLDETLGLLCVGFILGLAEWFVLRSHLNNSVHWILATSIGLASAVSLTQAGGNWMYMSGFFLGATQFLVFGKQYSKSGWWIFANMLGIAYWVFQVDTVVSLSTKFDWQVFAIAGLSTLIYGAATGITLVWLLQKNIQGKRLPNNAIMPSPSEDGAA
jgi:hypothetical protein